MFDEILEVIGGGWGVATAAVAGAGLLAVRGGRPLVKGAVKGYLTVSDTVRGWTATVVEQAQDLYEESKAELAAHSNPDSPAGDESSRTPKAE